MSRPHRSASPVKALHIQKLGAAYAGAMQFRFIAPRKLLCTLREGPPIFFAIVHDCQINFDG